MNKILLSLAVFAASSTLAAAPVWTTITGKHAEDVIKALTANLTASNFECKFTAGPNAGEQAHLYGTWTQYFRDLHFVQINSAAGQPAILVSSTLDRRANTTLEFYGIFSTDANYQVVTQLDASFSRVTSEMKTINKGDLKNPIFVDEMVETRLDTGVSCVVTLK